MRSAIGVEKKFSSRVEKESRGTLWQRSTRESMPTRARMVPKEGSGFVLNL